MAAKVQPVPAGYSSVTAYLIVEGAAAALDFYARAFGAREVMRLPAPGGRIGHAEIEIGDSRVMLADECPEMDARAPAAYGGSPVTLHLYVRDVDAVVARAVAAGAEVRRPVQDQFYGDRSGTLRDPFGHVWHLATHVEDVPPEEIQRRMQAMAGGKG
ncbi:VOC family protein [Siccirubricoccus sp. G192]|nr:VOC family protein [Siccirubricoccus sp. G192]